MFRFVRWILILSVALLSAYGSVQELDNWAVLPGYSLEIDSTGFFLPTSLAFVPDPGSAPKAPLYFVAELQGEVKVVTNDRSVHSFANVTTLTGQTPALDGAEQQGLAGLCLEPENGYVFVTFTYPDEGGVLRNNIVRYTTMPGSFGLEVSETLAFTELFETEQAAPAHQIGNCRVHEKQLYVGVGDGGNASNASSPDSLLGKVLCLSLAGEPCRGSDSPVWASGFRNPFGLAFVRNELFAAENGVSIDRFLKLRPGEDHGWNGSDQSLAAGADLVFTPTVSPVQLDFVEANAPFAGPDLAGHFVFSTFAGEHGETSPGAVALDYDFERQQVTKAPFYALQYIGDGEQHVLGFAAGPDGLYAAPAVPDAQGRGFVLKFRYNPGEAHTHVIPSRASLLVSASRLGLLNDYSCTGCHTVAGQGSGIGPALDKFALNWRLTERLNTESYEQLLTAVTTDPSLQTARQEVLAADGRERTYIWLKHYLQNPKFADPDVQMPDLGLSEAEAVAVRGELYRILNMDDPGSSGLWDRGLSILKRYNKVLAVGAAGGAVLTLLLLGLVALGLRSRPVKSQP